MVKSSPSILKWLALGVLLIGLGWIVFQRSTTEEGDEVVDAADPGPQRQERRVAGTPARDWDDLVALIDGGVAPDELQRQMTAVKGRWVDADPHVVAESIGRLLREGADRETGLDFETGHGGNLRSWPSLRVFLLDVLMSTDPDLAVELAREVLAETDSAEEYAVAMRALVMEKPWRASDEELQERLLGLLGRDDWQAERRAGFAEALDLPREMATAEAFESLAEWVDGSPEFVDAGEMAMHEFAADHASIALGELAADPRLLEENPGLRAGLMARADPADPAQLKAVEDYLGSAAVSRDEKRDFLKLFPLRSATTGFRLYGGNPEPFDRQGVIASDRAATVAVETWLVQGLGGLNQELQGLQQRLETWQRQSEAAEGR